MAIAHRALDERITLARRLHDQAATGGHRHVVESWAQKMRDYEQQAEVIRNSVRKIDEIIARSMQQTNEPETPVVQPLRRPG